jgi:hypothetical protein
MLMRFNCNRLVGTLNCTKGDVFDIPDDLAAVVARDGDAVAVEGPGGGSVKLGRSVPAGERPRK